MNISTITDNNQSTESDSNLNSFSPIRRFTYSGDKIYKFVFDLNTYKRFKRNKNNIK